MFTAICPTCKEPPKVLTFTKGPGRTLGGYALTQEGVSVEIPHDLEIPKCQCGTWVIDDALRHSLQLLEQMQVKTAVPIL